MPSDRGHGGVSPACRSQAAGQSQTSLARAYPAKTVLSDSTSSPNVPGTLFATIKWMIFGGGVKQTNSQCGKIFRKKVCSKDPNHEPETRFITCNDPLCPTCYTKFSKRLSDRVTERVMGYHEVYPEDPLTHTIFSPPQDVVYKNLKEAFATMNRIFQQNGGKAGVFWFHPYRIKPAVQGKLRRIRKQLEKEGTPKNKIPGFWKLAHEDVLKLGHLSNYLYYSPHFHGIISGYLRDSKSFNEQTDGWVYKKKGQLKTEDDVARLSHYLSTHAGWEWTKQSVRYVGKMSYNQLAREVVTKIREPEKCKVCGSPLHTYMWDDYAGKIGDRCYSEDRDTVKVVYRWFRRPKRKKKETTVGKN